MGSRKPLNDTAGYVASLRAPFGHLMITDRDNGGDWVDSDERWVVHAFDHQLRNMALLEASSLRRAREIMKDARDTGYETDWIDFNDHASDEPYDGGQMKEISAKRRARDIGRFREAIALFRKQC